MNPCLDSGSLIFSRGQLDFSCGVCDAVKDSVGLLDVPDGFEGELGYALYARANNDETAGAEPGRWWLSLDRIHCETIELLWLEARGRATEHFYHPISSIFVEIRLDFDRETVRIQTSLGCGRTNYY